MAGAGYKLFSTGDVLTATDVNTYLMQQTVMVFDDAAARTTALSGVVAEGMLSYLKDTNAVEVYDGANWVSSDDPNAIQNTIVSAKGDIIGASANDVPAVTSVGADGTTLVADSSTATGLAYIPTFFAGKNKIINGDFGVWQRGTSFSNPADASYTCDRFMIFGNGSGATKTVSQQTFTPGTAPVTGYEGTFFWRLAQTVAGTGATYNLMLQRIEDVRNFANQTVTFSAWLKADASRTLTFSINRNYGSGGSSMDYSVATSSNLSVTTAWTRFTFSFTMPSVSGKTIGAGSYLEACINFPNNTAQTLDIWGVQVEAGSTATAFQTATGTIQGELAACQRYYYRNFPAVSDIPLGQGSANGTRYIIGVIALPVSMRVAPTSAEFSALKATDGATAASTVAALASYGNSTTTATYYFDCTSGLTQYRNYKIETSSSAGYLGFSAEL